MIGDARDIIAYFELENKAPINGTVRFQLRLQSRVVEGGPRVARIEVNAYRALCCEQSSSQDY